MAKYGYYYIARKTFIKGLVNPKYQGWERDRKVEMLLKLSFDSFFYLVGTLYSFYYFRQESWFPASVGGQGSCGNIYEDYPDWPTDLRPEIERYFCFQLGVHTFSVFELIAIRRSTERKYYEWMLHHSVAATLILFSMMCNEIIAGLMILIVHDMSDVFMSFGRFFFEANFGKMIKNIFTQSLAITVVLMSWIYLRLTLFPFCMLK